MNRLSHCFGCSMSTMTILLGKKFQKFLGWSAVRPFLRLEKYILDDSNGLFDRIAALHGLERIASGDPECREKCVLIFTEKLKSCQKSDPTLNGFLISYLIELNATESIDVIRQAYERESVDLSVLGDFEDVEISLGLKKNRLKPSKYSAAIDELNNTFLASNQTQPVRHEKIGRNEPCPCGSGKKYKKCCINLESPSSDYDKWIKG